MESASQKLEYLPLANIVKSSCNQRFTPNENQIYKMVQTLVSGQPLPPIRIRIENNTHACYDGIHRMEAYRRCNISHIPAIIDTNISESNAMLNSWNYNNGRQCSEGEKATLCLKLYQDGMSVNQIMQQVLFQSEDDVKTYIKLALYLHPDMLILIVAGRSNNKINIPINAAKYLMSANKDTQPSIYNHVLHYCNSMN